MFPGNLIRGPILAEIRVGASRLAGAEPGVVSDPGDRIAPRALGGAERCARWAPEAPRG